MTAADLALAADPQIVERSVDPAGFVVQACERAKAWLEEALEHGGIGQIAEIKSQAEAVRVYTAQKQLGKDAQLAAAEIVRRAERGIGLAIRRGQERGEIRRRGQGGGQPPGARRPRDDKTMSSPAEFASQGELRGNGAGIYHLTDRVSDQQFDQALAAARADQDLSRANVVRKLHQRRGPAPPGPCEQAPVPGGASPAARPAPPELIARHAARGMTSHQIAARLGIGAGRVRQIAREHDIAIPADVVTGRARRLDSNRIAHQTVHALEGLAMSVQLADPGAFDPAQAGEWAASLSGSLRVLNRFARQIKEVTTKCPAAASLRAASSAPPGCGGCR